MDRNTADEQSSVAQQQELSASEAAIAAAIRLDEASRVLAHANQLLASIEEHVKRLEAVEGHVKSIEANAKRLESIEPHIRRLETLARRADLPITPDASVRTPSVPGATSEAPTLPHPALREQPKKMRKAAKIVELLQAHAPKLVSSEELAAFSGLLPQSVSPAITFFRQLGYVIESSKDLRERGEDVAFGGYRLVSNPTEGGAESVAQEDRSSPQFSEPSPEVEPSIAADTKVGPGRPRERRSVNSRIAARILGVTASTVVQWAKTGLVPAIRPRGDHGIYLFDKAELEKFLQRSARAQACRSKKKD